jgi:hypothetical protein
METMKRLLLVLAAALVLTAWRAAAVQPPGSPVPAGAAEPAPLYPITPEAGPWMIIAASYEGPEALELARQLVLEIRNRHHLPAYIFNYADAERKRQREDLERLQKLNPDIQTRRRTIRVPEQCAVLIGGYPDVDRASDALKKVRSLPLPNLKLASGASPFDTVFVAEPNEEKKGSDLKRLSVNPFATAFVVRNPTTPRQEAPKNKVDPFWKELNSEEKYSLLSNPKGWTLVVKEYPGNSALQPQGGGSSFMKMLGLGSWGGEALSAAGQQAHELASFLTKLGFKAYVLHTRYSSIVTVGAFDQINDQDMQRVQRQIQSLQFKTAQGATPDPIKLFATPVPMQVPRL